MQVNDFLPVETYVTSKYILLISLVLIFVRKRKWLSKKGRNPF